MPVFVLSDKVLLTYIDVNCVGLTFYWTALYMTPLSHFVTINASKHDKLLASKVSSVAARQLHIFRDKNTLECSILHYKYKTIS